jgi:CDP-diacylglycerol--serine O-phosphatidyltransferase
MEPRPRFLGQLGAADAVTVGNAVLGFAATAAVLVDVSLSARLVLFAGIADGLDGVVARRVGSSPVGEYLDSLADVASFGVAPAMLVVAVAHAAYGPGPSAPFLAAVAVAALFVGMAVVRLALYTANDVDDRETRGVQSTLAGTLLAALYLAGLPGLAGEHAALAFVALAGAFAYLMVTRVRYPELTDRDAFAMGAVQALAAVVPTALSRAFPRLLVVVAAAYLFLAPRFYWR